MSNIGSIGWIDLTVPNADAVRDFYASVVGWSPSPVDMGSYHDYTMTGPDNEEARAGICHARGGNAGIPPAWMIYINVEDLERSMQACTEGGGRIIGEPRSMGAHGRFCFIEDPAGAVCALFEPPRT
ncbi:MAG: VOC family protein [Saprospiraceae bacterium]|nr:VOC family protein [Saprospiraceae bacterium]